MLSDASVTSRRNAIDALGVTGGEDIATALAPCLSDNDEWTCRNTALALLRLGPDAAPVQNSIVAALASENRYVSAKAVQTLKRLGTQSAQQALLDYLFTARWCPKTSAASSF